MRHDLKQELAEAFAPPPPKDRDSFLATLPYPKLTYPGFVLSQIGYIRKRIWLASLMILLVGIGTVCILPGHAMLMVWVISALLPFLALLTAAEISRSDLFGMSEIESGCRFALPQVIGARMIILGICGFTVIAALAAGLGIFSAFGIARAALYLLTPYVLTGGISLAIFGRTRGQEGVYLSAAAALGICLAGMLLFRHESLNGIPTDLVMAAACTAGTLLITMQSRKLLTGKETGYGIET